MKKKSILFAVLVSVFLAPILSPMIAQTQNDTKLEYLIRLPKGDSQHAPLLVLLHGYGSNEQDLFSLSPHIPEHWLVVSVRAPHRMGNNSYKWYNVAMEDGKIKIDAQQEEQSRIVLGRFVASIIEKYKVDKKRVVVAGFSQGANMSLGLGLTSPETVSGFACFSGRFLDEIKPLVSKSASLKRLKAFIAHGDADAMLPIKYAEESIKQLQTLGIETVFVKDNIGHEISKTELIAFVNWLNKL
jgi:phospholipase/carboxylesterase